MAASLNWSYERSEVVLEHGVGIRWTIDSSVDIPEEVFLIEVFPRLSVSPTEPNERCLGVCTVEQLATYPAGIEGQYESTDQPFYRSAVADMVLSSAALLDEVIAQVPARLSDLCLAYDVITDLNAGGSGVSP